MGATWTDKVDHVDSVLAATINTIMDELKKGTLRGWYANTETLSDDLTLTDEDLPIQFLDPGGATRDVTLPEADGANHPFVIANTGSETMTFKDSTTATIDTVAADEVKIFISNGTDWAAVSGGGGSSLSKASAADALAGIDDEKYLTAVAAKGLPSIYPDATPDADHTAHGIKMTLTANGAQAFGDVCYIDANGKAAIGDADAIATAKIVVMCADASISDNASGNYLHIGPARDDSWNWTPGGLIYLSRTGTTGNTLTQTNPADDSPGADDCIVILGIATHADRILFNPQLSGIVEHI